MKIGQVCVKIAGRDSGKFCVVVEKIDDTYVIIDGNVRRKKCNIKHLEVLDKEVEIKEKAESADVKKALEKIGIKIPKKGSKRPRQERPRKVKKKFSAKEDKKKETKKEEKKEEKKEKKEEVKKE
tara:strand:+ start:189 stop:563 length:375 start_codon:yes stop_codon:yes gene_type:complete